MEHLPDWFPTAAGVGLIAFGLVAAAWAWYSDVRRAIASRRWPGVDGQVSCSWVEDHGWGDERTVKHKLVYHFQVDGVAFTGSRVKAGGNFDVSILGRPGQSWSSAALRQTRYRPGSPVFVLYDPENPNNCCLESGGLFCALAEVVVALALAAAGFWLLAR